MSGFDFIIRWIDVLAEIVERLREARRGRRSLFVTRNGERLVMRSGAGSDAPILVECGAEMPVDVLRRARDEYILLEWPEDRIVSRRLVLPAQAREFMRGVVDNQLERLSPWPATQILYGLAASPSSRPDSLDVCVSIASRGEVESARSELAERGLVVDRVVVTPREPPGAAPTILWSRNAGQREDKRRMRFVIGGGVAAYLAICMAIGSWAVSSAEALHAESEELATSARAIQTRRQAAESPQAVAALSPPERAWVRKETSISAVFLLESLSRILPDDAYLSDLQLEAGKVRIAGLAHDAPPLIAALETSGQLADVRFSAPTTRGPDGRSFHFSIEAQVVAHHELKGD